MIVIADTTHINYLILIGKAELLTAVYGDVVIPQAVQRTSGGTGPGLRKEMGEE